MKPLSLITTGLISIYPIIFLYTHNVEILTINQLLAPISIAVVFSFLLQGLFWKIFSDDSKSTIVTAIFITLFWTYELLYTTLSKVVELEHWYIFTFIFIFFSSFVLFMKYMKKLPDLEPMSKIVLVVVLVMVVPNILVLTPSEIQKHNINTKIISSIYANLQNSADNNYPDIYLIILDEYARLDTIKEEWDYDNSEFANFLKDSGFYVAQNSEQRFPQTTWNMSSLFNLDYIANSYDKAELIKFFYNQASMRGTKVYNDLIDINDGVGINMIRDNFFVNYLKEYKYQVVVLEGISHYFPSFKIDNADISVSYKDVEKAEETYLFSLDEFDIELLKMTMFYPLETSLKIDRTNNRIYDGTKYVFEYLKRDIHQIESPKFTYVHIVCPHPPYVFDRDGSYRAEVKAEDKMEAYLEQYIYITDQVKDTVTKIQKKSADEPIIIIQSDHGPRPHHIGIKDREQPFKVFNAIYFPGEDYQTLYDNISPINTLRVMLNQFFSDDFEMLEDR